MLAVCGLVATVAPPAHPQPAESIFDNVIVEPLDPDGLVGLVDRSLYRGRLIVSSSGSGLRIVNELPPEDYLKGIGEIPSSWPLEAQKAQAVAARSYLMAYGGEICATDACQVYAGAEKELAAPLWRQAVAETDSLVMVYNGTPTNAKYHSTSGGHTRSNLEVYGTEIPYLQGVPDPEDAVSPLHHWAVKFPIADLEEALRSRDDTSPPPGRLIEVTRPPSASLFEPVTVVTEDGAERRTATLEALKVLVRVNNFAPSRFPDRYPGPTESGNGYLPLTIPGEEFTTRTEGGVVTFDGRGFGHYVGMSQYGAKGKAERGWTFDQILGAYYTGVGLARYPMPPLVRVLLLEGGESYKVSSNGPFRLLDGTGRVIEGSTLGGWELVAEDVGVRLNRPAGFDAPLSIAEVTLLEVPTFAPSGQATPAPPRPAGPSFTAQAAPGALRFTLTTPARIDAALEGSEGSRKLGARVLDAGDRELRLGDLFQKVLPKPGNYRIRLIATDTRGGRVETEIPYQVAANARALVPASAALFGLPAAPGSPAPAALSRAPSGKGGGVPLAYVLALAAVALVAVGAWRVRAWLERMEPVMPPAEDEPTGPRIRRRKARAG